MHVSKLITSFGDTGSVMTHDGDLLALVKRKAGLLQSKRCKEEVRFL